MQNRRLGLSLRYKLLIILTVLPLLSLTAYLFMATQLFERDKVAYVFDSSTAVSRFLSSQIRVEVDAFLNVIKPVVEGYNYQTGGFSSLAQDLFLKQGKVDALVLYQKNERGGYTEIGKLVREESAVPAFLQDRALHSRLQTRALSDQIIVSDFKDGSGIHMAIGYRLGDLGGNHLMLIALYRSPDLVETFSSASMYRSVLITKDGQVALGSSVLEEGFIDAAYVSQFFGPVLQSKTPEGTAEVISIQNRPMLLSYSHMGIGGLSVASVVDKKKALAAVDMMVAKSILFFVALLSATVLISVFASIQLTSTLRELYEATLKIAQGDFDVRVRSRSRDEVGGLAESFNWMAGEVSRLLSETAEKARMENELATVKTVQETLFPQSHNRFGPFEVVGHFEPASECGGDWWSYSKVGNKLYLWIGDATGHGAPAALITSAARSAAAIVESLPEITPAKALSIMNRAIHETSKGQIMMTFFLGCIDTDANTLTYANASHDPPYLMRKQEGRKLGKKDLVPLMDEIGPRLGEQAHSDYKEIQLDLTPGDSILFYTDGIIDLHNPKGEAWGERQFLRTLIKSVDEGGSADDKMQRLISEIKEYRQESALIDDITLFMCQYEKAG